ncbi:MAG: hypothetical protein BXU00_03320 [Candidatus Nanoclepta minutus]|uniref:AAA+ ATPase domain-containing protein n=1 Tax=Candidatus Nanoclepta minutus TaxID=1940235 RepID=A0A397WNC2_9ARCH|nr:MAG: hypothetical protein BXU00_03320 [Candidatus Nanoclepta minutus]
MKMFISGNPMSGKTSLIKRLIEDIGKDKFFGFYTEEIRENKKRIGFKIVTTYGDEKILSKVDIITPYRVGKYHVIKENLDEVSKYMIENLEKNSKKIIIIDEIGPMEMYSEVFNELIRIVLKKDINLIATVHRKLLYIVPTYIWLERGNWWDWYNYIKNKIIKEIL